MQPSIIPAARMREISARDAELRGASRRERTEYMRREAEALGLTRVVLRNRLSAFRHRYQVDLEVSEPPARLVSSPLAALQGGDYSLATFLVRKPWKAFPRAVEEWRNAHA